MTQIVLGINAYHADSSACIVVDGELVAAAEEERFRREKHWAGVPTLAIEYCLREAGVGLGAVDHVATNRDPRSSLRKKVAYTIARRPSPRLVMERLSNARAWMDVEDMLRQVAEMPEHRDGGQFTGKVHRVEHHLAHLASAYYAAPFPDAVAVSIDGFGDFASTAWGFGQRGHLSLDDRVYFPHSLGAFYQSITQFLGFEHYGDEYKVMGLAPYGEPSYADQLRKVVLLKPDGAFELNAEYFRFQKESTAYQWVNQTPQFAPMYSDRLATLLGPQRAPADELTQRHKDIARSAQVVYEDALFHLLTSIHRRYGVNRLVLAGGCGQNSVANGKISQRTPFEETYIPPSPPDAGGAVGAAAHVWHQVIGGETRRIGDVAFLGPSFDGAYIEDMLRQRRDDLSECGARAHRVANTAELCRRTADAIASGSVIGWFQGRMEWGPRALGNRSILCDPRRADMKQILNAKIKRRESFRPFAPSILRPAVAEWFEIDDDVPYMGKVLPIREAKRPLIPAVAHVDGTGRLQTVAPSDNPVYYQLIEAFRDLTGVPMVLNTSFNENEPIVCKPEEALNCFLRTDMDVLVLNDFMVERVRDADLDFSRGYGSARELG